MSENAGQSREGTDAVRWFALMVVTALISVVFVRMVGHFLLALMLAAIAADMMKGFYHRALRLTGHRSGLATLLTLSAFGVAIIVPLIGIVTMAVEQAASLLPEAHQIVSDVSQEAQTGQFDLPSWVPEHAWLSRQIENALAKLSELAGGIATFLLGSLSVVTRGAAVFFLHLFVFIYGLAFFISMEVPPILQVLRLSGLSTETQERLYERMIGTSRATLKVMLVIGVLQGVAGGLAFWATGIGAAAFWSVVMAVFAMIPGVGAQVIVFCGAIYFAIEGDMIRAGALAVWGGVMAVLVDNMLRPALVRRDSGLHDVLILVSTLGGLGIFGAPGLVLGPVVAAIFVSIWTDWAEVNGSIEPAGAPPKSRAKAEDSAG
ncbi:AI-2E family transporter [Chachezhania sediminis]|uniref:AI-2E family transporter n=1 Tax=Chachezhania sediminis TaxID=2599291 RepID=UPI00131DC44D|nr:AI-2E family transporter [Chachezhania sediminis]